MQPMGWSQGTLKLLSLFEDLELIDRIDSLNKTKDCNAKFLDPEKKGENKKFEILVIYLSN